MTLDEQARKMSSDWDARAHTNARHFIATGKETWSDEEFFASGERTVEHYVLTDLSNITSGKDSRELAVLEIGCGAGRVTRAFAKLFGEVHAVDVSAEMVLRAREATREYPHVHIYQNSGMDLRVIPREGFDFAFSFLVFQHIPSYEIVARYIQETARLLRPGALFKFQAQGYEGMGADPGDTWLGVGFSEERMRGIAESAGFEMRYCTGAGTQDFWIWLFRK